MTTRTHTVEDELLVSRFAARVAAALGAGAEALPYDVTERLRAAREQARSASVRQRQTQLARVPAVVGRTGGGAGLLAGPSPWWLKLASGLPVLVLLAGLILIDHWTNLEQVHAAAEIDAMLLADDLPPTAYADPGFAEFLKTPQE